MNITTLSTIFAVGFVVMAPVGPVSTICIRRSLMYGPRAGIAAGMGDAIAVAAYALIGATGSALLPPVFAHFTTVWHVVVATVLVAVSILLWCSRPTLLPQSEAPSNARLLSGFGAALGIALANPADIILFTALFGGLGITVHTPIDQALFYAAFFAGGVAYWIAVALFLNRWRVGLTSARLIWLNRACSGLMLSGAVASLVSLVRVTS